MDEHTEPRQHHQPKKHKLRYWVISGVILLFIIAAASNGNKNNASNSSDSNNTNTVQSTASTEQPSITQQVNDWENKYGSIYTKLENDDQKIHNDATASDIAQLEVDCQSLETDVTTALSYPAIPAASVAAHFSSAMTYYQTAAQQCATGAHDVLSGEGNYDAGLVNQGTSEIEASATALGEGNTQLNDANQAMLQPLD